MYGHDTHSIYYTPGMLIKDSARIKRAKPPIVPLVSNNNPTLQTRTKVIKRKERDIDSRAPKSDIN